VRLNRLIGQEFVKITLFQKWVFKVETQTLSVVDIEIGYDDKDGIVRILLIEANGRNDCRMIGVDKANAARLPKTWMLGDETVHDANKRTKVLAGGEGHGGLSTDELDFVQDTEFNTLTEPCRSRAQTCGDHIARACR